MNKPEKLTKEWVREHFPVSVGMADQFREVFGQGVEITAATEGGLSLGKFTDESRYTVIQGKQLLTKGKVKT